MWFLIRAKRVSNWHTPQKKSARLPACTCQKILVLVFTYVSTTYVRTSARYRICIYVCAFRPCTSTSDDSYIYQLSLVLATATVSFYHYVCITHMWHEVYTMPITSMVPEGSGTWCVTRSYICHVHSYEWYEAIGWCVLQINDRAAVSATSHGSLEKTRTRMYLYVCCLHIKQFFLPNISKPSVRADSSWRDTNSVVRLWDR